MRTRLGDASRRLDLAASRLGQRDLRQQLSMRKRELLSCLQALAAAAERYLMQRRARLEQASGKLPYALPCGNIGARLFADLRRARALS